jgi:hypothetical protein
MSKILNRILATYDEEGKILLTIIKEVNLLPSGTILFLKSFFEELTNYEGKKS